MFFIWYSSRISWINILYSCHYNPRFEFFNLLFEGHFGWLNLRKFFKLALISQKVSQKRNIILSILFSCDLVYFLGDWSQMKKLKPPILQTVYVWHKMSKFFHLRSRIINLYLRDSIQDWAQVHYVNVSAVLPERQYLSFFRDQFIIDR